MENERLLAGLETSDDAAVYKILTNSNAKVGDALIITKPIGIGIINTAIKGEPADQDAYDIAVNFMTTSNKYAAEAAIKVG